MKQIVTGHNMKEIERFVMEKTKISPLILMERAALCVTERIINRYTKDKKICIVCGRGNNGADGVAIARQLVGKKYQVTVVVLGDAEKSTEEMNYQLAVYKNCGGEIKNKIPKEDYDCFVDAIFGVGLSRPIIDENIKKAIETINGSGAYIYSVDVPSGICSDTGKVMSLGVRADETVTFSYQKYGLCICPGKMYAGKILVKEIGLDVLKSKSEKISHFSIDLADAGKILKRNPDTNKGDFGKVTVIAGSDEVSGACILCAEAVLRSGAGMVKVVSEAQNIHIIKNRLPEAMTLIWDDKEDMFNKLKEVIEWSDCVVIGPGIGQKIGAYYKLKAVLNAFPEDKTLIVDADGINLIGQNEELKKLAGEVKRLIYTPHMAELSRLLGYEIKELKDDLDPVMEQVLKDSDCIYVCKDSVTRVYQKNRPIYVNAAGNSGMATAGCGDVLAGVLASFASRKGINLFESTITAVYLHSMAGDMAAKSMGENAVLAGDILKALPEVMKNVEEAFDV